MKLFPFLDSDKSTEFHILINISAINTDIALKLKIGLYHHHKNNLYNIYAYFNFYFYTELFPLENITKLIFFLAHLRDEVSQGELLWSLCVRRPSVVNFCFKSLLLSNQLSNSIKTSQEWSLSDYLPKLLKQPWPN